MCSNALLRPSSASVSTPSFSNRTSYFLPEMIASPPKLHILSLVCACVLSCLLPSCCLSVVFNTRSPFLLSGFVWMWSCYVLLQHCLVVKCPVALTLKHILYLTLHNHTFSKINKPPSLGIFLDCISTSELKLKDA